MSYGGGYDSRHGDHGSYQQRSGFGGGGGGYGGGGFGGGGGYGGGGGHRGGDINDVQLSKVDFRNLPAFEKNFYHEHPAVTARSVEQVDQYRRTRDIHVTGHGVPKPVSTFEEASFPGDVIF